MRIVSVILERKVISRILGHLARKGIKPGRIPRKAHAARNRITLWRSERVRPIVARSAWAILFATQAIMPIRVRFSLAYSYLQLFVLTIHLHVNFATAG